MLLAGAPSTHTYVKPEAAAVGASAETAPSVVVVVVVLDVAAVAVV